MGSSSNINNSIYKLYKTREKMRNYLFILVALFGLASCQDDSPALFQLEVQEYVTYKEYTADNTLVDSGSYFKVLFKTDGFIAKGTFDKMKAEYPEGRTKRLVDVGNGLVRVEEVKTVHLVFAE